MRKGHHATLATAFALLLLALGFLLIPGVGPGGLNSEKVFIAELHNSLYYLDQAKWKWVEEMNKSDREIPTMADLAPYLGNWTNRIQQFIALGITYKITPTSEMKHQSDIATLNRDLYFRSGICQFYPAGTSYGIQTRWSHRHSDGWSLRIFYINNRGLLAAASFIAGIAVLTVADKRSLCAAKDVSSVTNAQGINRNPT